MAKDEGNAGLDECREYIVGCMESVRRYLSHLYAKGTNSSRVIDVHETAAEPKPLQMSIIFSLQSSGMANLELELLPFLLDLLKNHFPGMVGAVYILHYGWVHSGMWALAKRVLPQQALAKIFFPGAAELEEHFELDRLPICLGGERDVALNDESNDVMKRFARPGLHGVLYSSGSVGTEDGAEWESNSAPPSPRGISGTSSPAFGRSSRNLSRRGSFDSMVDEFYSTENTPWHLTPRASQASTPHAELTHYPFGSTATHASDSTSPVISTLRMTPKAANKLRQLQMTRGVGGSRSRTTSDVNRRTGIDYSPVVSRGNSPNRTRRRTVTMQASRNGHFGGAGQGSETGLEKRGELLSRVGSLRDFRLLQDNLASSDMTVTEESESGASDRSGKVGESTSEERDKQAKTGFFARWRRLSSQEAGGKGDTAGREAADMLTEVEPNPLPSPTLQVPDIEEPPLSGYGSLSEANEVLSRRTRKFNALPGHVSPYNASNPFYGYPAFPLKPSEATRRSGPYDPSHHGQDAHRLHFRKRKRDLLRTLMYLFVLRLLSMHRGVRNQALAAYRGLVRAIRVGGVAEAGGEDEDWREATLRYNKLRTATSRQQESVPDKGTPRRGQPLVQLGFRKRYAFFLLFLFVIARRQWRIRLHAHVREALALAGFGRLSLEQRSVPEGAGDGLSDAELLGLDREVPLAASYTGLHLRRRLGWS